MQIFMIVTSQKGVIDMRAGFIGAGKVGFSLGKYLKENGVEITGYFSKSPESAKSAADFTNTKLYKSIENILSDSDTLFITVPDGQISKVWDYMKNLDIKNKNICHCSGSISSTVFFDGENLGANIYSVHPLYAISDKCESWKHLNKAYFTVEGSAENLDEIKSIFERAGNKVIAMGAENKSLYHCGAVVVSNLVNGLFQVGAEMLVKCGFDKKDAKKQQDGILQVSNVTATSLVEKPDVPLAFALLPVLPLALLIFFSPFVGLFQPTVTLGTTTAMLFSLFLSLVFVLFHTRSVRTTFNVFASFWKGMGNVFTSVVTLIVASEVFSKGLIGLGFIDSLVGYSSHIGLSGLAIAAIFTLIIFGAAMLMGSGNAAFFSFGPLLPGIATQLGLPVFSLILPLQLAASMGRAASPIAGVIVAIAGVAVVSSVELARS